MTLSVVKTEFFCCPCCGQTSHGPFVTHGANGPVEWGPRCRNDNCQDKWWNRIPATPMSTALRQITDAEVMKRQAPSRK